MTREERELSIEYLEKIKEDYIEGNAYERHPLPEYYAIENAIKALEQEPKTGSLDDAREDFMHDVYNELDFLPTNEEANRIIDSFDMVAKGIKQEPRWIPVSERLPEEEGLYLVTRRNTDDVATFIFRRTITSEDYWKRCATAWMPLPEPYKAESEV